MHTLPRTHAAGEQEHMVINHSLSCGLMHTLPRTHAAGEQEHSALAGQASDKNNYMYICTMPVFCLYLILRPLDTHTHTHTRAGGEQEHRALTGQGSHRGHAQHEPTAPGKALRPLRVVHGTITCNTFYNSYCSSLASKWYGNLLQNSRVETLC